MMDFLSVLAVMGIATLGWNHLGGIDFPAAARDAARRRQRRLNHQGIDVMDIECSRDNCNNKPRIGCFCAPCNDEIFGQL